jgi:hypothetical protein
MVVNFKTRKISRDMCKLTQTSILITIIKKKNSISVTASSQFHQNNQYLNMGNCCFHFVKKYKEKHIGFVLLYNFPEIE